MQAHPRRRRAICGSSRGTLPNEEVCSGCGRRASGAQWAVAERKAKGGLGRPVSHPEHGDTPPGASRQSGMGSRKASMRVVWCSPTRSGHLGRRVGTERIYAQRPVAITAACPSSPPSDEGGAPLSPARIRAHPPRQCRSVPRCTFLAVVVPKKEWVIEKEKEKGTLGCTPALPHSLSNASAALDSVSPSTIAPTAASSAVACYPNPRAPGEQGKWACNRSPESA